MKRRAFWFFLCFFPFCHPLFAEGTGSTQFEGRALELDTPNKTFRMEGDALLRNASMELRADHIAIGFQSRDGSKNFSDKNVETLKARGKVRINREGLLSQGTEAFYSAAKGHLLVKGSPASVSGTDFYLTGAEVLYAQQKEEMDVKGTDEKPTSFHHANDGTPIVIHSRSQKWDMTKGEARFSGNIRAKTGTRTLEAEELLVAYHKKEKDPSAKTGDTDKENIVIDTVTATGKVFITDVQGTGRGDKAVFTEKDDMLFLTGQPAEVKYQGHTIRGPQIRMNQKTGEMEVSGGALGRILPKDKKQ